MYFYSSGVNIRNNKSNLLKFYRTEFNYSKYKVYYYSTEKNYYGMTKLLR